MATLDSKAFELTCEAATTWWVTDPDLTLPQLNIEISFTKKSGAVGKIHKKDPAPLVLIPNIKLDTRVGSRLDVGFTPIYLTAQGDSDVVARGDAIIPLIQLEVRTSIQADTRIELPILAIEAEATTPVLCTLSEQLPGLIPAISGSGGPISLDGVLCFLSMDAAVLISALGGLNQSLPGLKISAHGLSGAVGAGDATIPELRADADSLTMIIASDSKLPYVLGSATGRAAGSTAEANLPELKVEAGTSAGAYLEAVLPEITVDAVGGQYIIYLSTYLPQVDSDSDGNTASRDDDPGSEIPDERFDGTLLRYERWA